MNTVITACVFGRPDIYARVLESYRHVRGIDKLIYIPVFDHGFDPRCLDALVAATWLRPYPVFNDKKLGCDYNTWEAVHQGFSNDQVDAIIHAEDDILWAPDTLEYLLWGLEQYQEDPTIFTIGAHNGDGRDQPLSKKVHHAVTREQWFNPWVWATWRDRGFDILKTNPLANSNGWDWTMNHVVRGHRYRIVPCLSRTKHIGSAGVHVTGSEDWFESEASEKRDWSGKHFFASQPYREVSLIS